MNFFFKHTCLIILLSMRSYKKWSHLQTVSCLLGVLLICKTHFRNLNFLTVENNRQKFKPHIMWRNQKGYTAVCLCRRRLADEDGEHFAIKRMQKISQSKRPNFFFHFLKYISKVLFGFCFCNSVLQYSIHIVASKGEKKLTFTFFSKQLIV